MGKEDDPASYWVETVSFQGRIVKLPGGKASKGENHHPKGSLAFFFYNGSVPTSGIWWSKT